MSSMPPDHGDPDDVDAVYRRWSAADTARPSSDTAKRILANAAAVALEVKQRSAQRRSIRRRRTMAFAGLAAAAFAGLLVTPLFFRSQPAAVISVEDKKVPALAPSLDAPLKQRNAELAYDASLSAGKRGAAASPMQAQRIDRDGALRRAAAIGDAASVSALLEEPIDINGRDSDGRTPLLLAVAAGRDSVVALLLAHGADPNASDASGETPLRAALTARHPQIEAALRRAGAR